MTEILIYQTSNPDFASQVVDTLNEAKIECYKIGRGYYSISRYLYRTDFGNGISIYIRHQEDYQKANQILINLGAVIETPIKFKINKGILIILLCISVGIYFAATIHDNRVKTYYKGTIESITYQNKSLPYFYNCNIRLDSGDSIDIKCDPTLILRKNVNLMKFKSSMSDKYIYQIMYFDDSGLPKENI